MISSPLTQPLDDELLYPDSDGKPMAENTEQYRWIVTIKENLERQFRDDPQVFIAADLFWYPIERTELTTVAPQAPDVMVVFGRPKGRRGSYRQWQEDQIPPQVVFEILSPSNLTAKGQADMEQKFTFYQTYGVEEYYVYDPDNLTLAGWLRQGDQLKPIATLLRRRDTNAGQWVSPRLGIRFGWQPGEELTLYYSDGSPFLSFVELGDRLDQERQRADQERQRADQRTVQLRQVILNLQQQGLTRPQIAQLTGLPADQLTDLGF